METIPYSMDFAGATTLAVTQTDYTQNDGLSQAAQITDLQVISRVVELLSELPREGKLMAKMGPVVAHTVVAYKEDKPFAQIEFYGDMLKTEDTSFFGTGPDDPVTAKEKELFELIRIR